MGRARHPKGCETAPCMGLELYAFKLDLLSCNQEEGMGMWARGALEAWITDGQMRS